LAFTQAQAGSAGACQQGRSSGAGNMQNKTKTKKQKQKGRIFFS
jgi:hypothetical protein